MSISNKWAYWNTLGVAAFRNRDWTTAHDSLKKSIALTGEKPHDLFFLAMTHWKQANFNEARQCFDKAVDRLKKEPTQDPDVLRSQAEAASELGLPCPKSTVAVGPSN